MGAAPVFFLIVMLPDPELRLIRELLVPICALNDLLDWPDDPKSDCMDPDPVFTDNCPSILPASSVILPDPDFAEIEPVTSLIFISPDPDCAVTELDMLLIFIAPEAVAAVTAPLIPVMVISPDAFRAFTDIILLFGICSL